MLSGKIKLLYNDEILDEYFEFLLRSKTLEVFQKNTRKHTLSDKTFILFLIAQPRHSTSGKPSVHIRHFHGSKNEQILIFQNRFQLIVNTHSRYAFVRLQEIASGHKQQRLTNFVELLSKLFHPCRMAKTEHSHPLGMVVSTHFRCGKGVKRGLKNGALPFNID